MDFNSFTVKEIDNNGTCSVMRIADYLTQRDVSEQAFLISNNNTEIILLCQGYHLLYNMYQIVRFC